MRRLFGLRQQVHDAIDELTSLIEEKHEIAVQQWLVRLSGDEPLGRVARRVDEVRSGVARKAFDGVRQANRGVQEFCDRGLDLLRDALERRAEKDAIARREPDRVDRREGPTR